MRWKGKVGCRKASQKMMAAWLEMEVVMGGASEKSTIYFPSQKQNASLEASSLAEPN